jgi:hypothetical protein
MIDNTSNNHSHQETTPSVEFNFDISPNAI